MKKLISITFLITLTVLSVSQKLWSCLLSGLIEEKGVVYAYKCCVDQAQKFISIGSIPRHQLYEDGLYEDEWCEASEEGLFDESVVRSPEELDDSSVEDESSSSCVLSPAERGEELLSSGRMKSYKIGWSDVDDVFVVTEKVFGTVRKKEFSCDKLTTLIELIKNEEGFFDNFSNDPATLKSLLRMICFLSSWLFPQVFGCLEVLMDH